MMDVTIVPVGMLGTNCYLLKGKDKSCAVIDPGAQPEKIIQVIEDAGLTPRLLLLTHGHHDHIGGVNKLLERYPEMRAYIGENDAEMLADPDKSYAAVRYQKADDFLVGKVQTLTDGVELVLDELSVRVLDTPGHTKGGVTFLCGDAMFSGDTLFRGDCGRCDLYGGDYAVMLKSLKKLADLDGDYVVYPGHGESSTLHQERKTNRYILEACS